MNSDIKTPVWPVVQEALMKRVGGSDYSSWLSSLNVSEQPQEYINGPCSVIIKAENQYKMKWVVSKYGNLIEELFAQALDKKGRGRPKIVFCYKSKKNSNTVSSLVNRPTRVNNERSTTKYTSYIDSHNTLASFITCDANLIAKELAMDTIKDWAKPKRGAKPHHGSSIICGSSGLGKTHLMHSIANELNKQNKQLNILYVTAEHFVTIMVNSLMKKTINDLKTAFCSADLLMLDDIHFFTGKEKTQLEFLNIYNHLMEKKRPLILSCDRPPQKLTGINSQLKTRLSHSLITPIAKPDVDARATIVQSNARKFKFELDDKCALQIASRIDRSVRDLEGAVKMVVFYAQTLKKPVTIELINRVLSDIVPPPSSKVDTAMILKVVAAYYDVSVEDIKSSKRNSSVTLCRQMAMFLCREMTSHSTTEIGKQFGGKNHSTVIYSCANFEKKMKQDAQVKQAHLEVKAKITRE